MRAIVVLLLMAGALALGAACSSSSADDATFPQVVTLGKGDVFPQINNSALAVGENRLSLGLTDRDGNKVLGAAVHLQFYDLTGDKPQLRSEVDAAFVPVALSYIDEQSQNNKVTPAGSDGAYVAAVSFDRAGDWGMKVTVTEDGHRSDPVPFRFNVLEHTPEPAVGDRAPASEQVTTAAVSDETEIDSSYPPRPAMHTTTIAAALASGRPLVIAFATPAFCTSRVCAPVMDTVMDPLSAEYGDHAVFIHVEPYELTPLRQSNIMQPVRATTEWQLQSEPWIFVVGRDGRIVAKFEGITSAEEVRAALDGALQGS